MSISKKNIELVSVSSSSSKRAFGQLLGTGFGDRSWRIHSLHQSHHSLFPYSPSRTPSNKPRRLHTKLQWEFGYNPVHHAFLNIKLLFLIIRRCVNLAKIIVLQNLFLVGACSVWGWAGKKMPQNYIFANYLQSRKLARFVTWWWVQGLIWLAHTHRKVPLFPPKTAHCWEPRKIPGRPVWPRWRSPANRSYLYSIRFSLRC